MSWDHPRSWIVVAVVAVGCAGWIGYTAGDTGNPSPQVINRNTVSTPTACLRALDLADAELSDAAALVAAMNRIAPLVDRAYQAGLNNNTDPGVIDRVSQVNDRISRVWKRMVVAPNTHARVAERCRNA